MPKPEATHPKLGLVVFFLIAFGLPWTGLIALRLTIGLGHLFDSFAYFWFMAGPSIAGFVAAFVEGGWRGFGTFARRAFNLRFAVWIWSAALFLPLFAALLTFVPHVFDLLKGGAPKWQALFGTLSLMNFFTGPLAEEFGWRGYLLGRLVHRMRPALAGLLIGFIWAAWHIPLFYDSVFAHLSSALGYVGWVVAWSVVLSLIVTKAQGSVLPSVIGHWAANAAPAIFFALLPALPGEAQPGGLTFTVTSLIVALFVALAWGRARWMPKE